MILAIDPGLHSGWSVLSEVEGLLDLGYGETWPLGLWPGKFQAIIECPEVYPDTRAPQANNLITLALRVGRYQERLEAKGVPVRLVLPKVWKGQLPKPVHHIRGRKKMTPKEQAIEDRCLQLVPLSHHLDAKDARNLALWAAGRLPKSGY